MMAFGIVWFVCTTIVSTLPNYLHFLLCLVGWASHTVYCENEKINFANKG